MKGNVEKFFKETSFPDDSSQFSDAISSVGAYGGDIKLPAKNNEMISYILLNNATINQNGGISIKYPNPKYQKPSEKSKQQEELLRESIEKELAAMNGVQKATVDFDKKEATVEFDAAVLTPEKLFATVEATGDGATYKVVAAK
jgi:copper chaperone CopZ